MLLAHPVLTGITLHALIPVHAGPPDGGVNGNGADGADSQAIPAGHTLLRIDAHATSLAIVWIIPEGNGEASLSNDQ
jgi:hypothetical protein